MKRQKSNDAKWEGWVSVAWQKWLHRLSCFLQQWCSRLSRRQLHTILVVGMLLGTACCGFVVWRSMQPAKGLPWRITSIKAFPLPPPITLPQTGPAGKDTLQLTPRQ